MMCASPGPAGGRPASLIPLSARARLIAEPEPRRVPGLPRTLRPAPVARGLLRGRTLAPSRLRGSVRPGIPPPPAGRGWRRLRVGTQWRSRAPRPAGAPATRSTSLWTATRGIQHPSEQPLRNRPGALFATSGTRIGIATTAETDRVKTPRFRRRREIQASRTRRPRRASREGVGPCLHAFAGAAVSDGRVPLPELACSLPLPRTGLSGEQALDAGIVSSLCQLCETPWHKEGSRPAGRNPEAAAWALFRW
jgi:hypothetical protein